MKQLQQMNTGDLIDYLKSGKGFISFKCVHRYGVMEGDNLDCYTCYSLWSWNQGPCYIHLYFRVCRDLGPYSPHPQYGKYSEVLEWVRSSAPTWIILVEPLHIKPCFITPPSIESSAKPCSESTKQQPEISAPSTESPGLTVGAPKK